MSWTNDRTPGSQRRGYHHGNLREALIQAAQELIGAKGPAGFTIAEAARLAGVSPRRPLPPLPRRRVPACRGRDPRLRSIPRSPRRRARRMAADPPVPRRPSAAPISPSPARNPLSTPPCSRPGIAREAIPRTAGRRRPRLRRAARAGGAVGRRRASRPPAARADDRLHLWSTAHGIASLFGRADASAARCPCRPRSCWRRPC